jgi:uncharacterized protein (TIGR03435 family)
MRSATMLCGGFLALTGPLLAQSLTPPGPATTPSFEVASVKPNVAPPPPMFIQFQPGGGVVIQNLPLLQIVEFAYQLQRDDDRLVGAPEWMANERFDIVAKAPAGVGLGTMPLRRVGAPAPGLLMLRTLLAERFGLRLRTETRERPIFALVTANADGRLGPRMTRADADCEQVAANRRAGKTPPPTFAPGPIAPCSMLWFRNRIVLGSQPLAELADYLSASLRRHVVDRTGLTGLFDFDLTWTPDQPPPADAPDRIVVAGTEIDLTGGVKIDPNGAGMLTALREQLGLKLESTRGPVDVFVVEGVERPTPD